jgi:hypothetical protein
MWNDDRKTFPLHFVYLYFFPRKKPEARRPTLIGVFPSLADGDKRGFPCFVLCWKTQSACRTAWPDRSYCQIQDEKYSHNCTTSVNYKSRARSALLPTPAVSPSGPYPRRRRWRPAPGPWGTAWRAARRGTASQRRWPRSVRTRRARTPSRLPVTCKKQL